MVQNNAIARRVERCVVNRAVIVYRVISSDLNTVISVAILEFTVLDAAFSLFRCEYSNTCTIGSIIEFDY